MSHSVAWLFIQSIRNSTDAFPNCPDFKKVFVISWNALSGDVEKKKKKFLVDKLKRRYLC